MLILVHLAGMDGLATVQRLSGPRPLPDGPGAEAVTRAFRRRFFAYRALVRLASLGAACALALWLGWPRG